MDDITEKLKKLYPNTKWYGPYLREDNRKYLVKAEMIDGKIPKKGLKSSVMLARCLLEVHLNRKLEENEHADHINGDKTDDTLGNLQVLSVREHRLKSGLEIKDRYDKVGRKEENVICPSCGKVIVVDIWRIKTAEDKGRLVTCSRTCKSMAYGRNQYKSHGKLCQ